MPKSGDSDSELEQHTGSSGIERTKPWTDSADVPWSVLDEDQLADAYWSVVAPAMRADGLDPESERPTYKWLSANGFRGLTYTLSEYHETTLAEWWEETLGFGSDDGYEWDITDQATRESMQQYLAERHRDTGWSETTRETVRYRLARFAHSHRERHGSDDLLTLVQEGSGMSETESVDQIRDTYRYMAGEFAESTIARVHDAISGWFAWLQDRHIASINPTSGAEEWFDWSRSSETDPVALDAGHVRALYQEAPGTKERLLVVALCAWGLRSGEVAALHEDQLYLDANQPHIDFQERKNGPGTVALVYGVQTARRRLMTTGGGYLFPSERSESGHVTASTIADWFHNLADRAGLPAEIEGEPRKPHMGRRYWYDAYSQTIEDLLAHIEEIAAEQGSNSAWVVLEDYLSEERRRTLRREYMKYRLSEAFGRTEGSDI